MSQTTKNLNALIERMNEDYNAYIKRATEAERDLDSIKESRDYAQERMLALRTLLDRAEERIDRLSDGNAELDRENRYLSTQLAKYAGLRIKEAATWLRETSIEDLTTLINADRDPLSSQGRAYQPLVDKIPVIKAVRNKWDLGLKESKDVVDAWYAEAKDTFDKDLAASPSIEPIGGIEQYQAEGR
jgi:hypothetical protein